MKINAIRTEKKSCTASCCHTCSSEPAPSAAIASDDLRASKQELGAIPTGYELSHFYIAEMDCPVEENLIRKKLGTMTTVDRIEFNLMKQMLTVVHQTGQQDAVSQAIRSLGMTPIRQESASDKPQNVPDKATAWWSLALAALLAFCSELVHWFQFSDWLAAGLALGAIGLSGVSTYHKGWIALRHGNLNINALMSIAVTGALLLQQWPEAAMVMVLFTLAEWIEGKSLDRARQAIQQLVALAPQVASIRQSDGSWLDIAVDDIRIGNVMQIKPGERIALDAEVIEGQSSVNQAPITGESMPVEKQAHDPVYAGTINTLQTLICRVTSDTQHSTLTRIIQAVENAQGNKAPIQRFIDQFARIYTPAVFGFAILVAIIPPLFMSGDWFTWIYNALVLLVIACPCALVISTPVTVVSGLAAAARLGILIKGGIYLEQGYRLRTLFLDKTGTLTHGQPRLTDTIHHTETPDEVALLAASLAAYSDHPVSIAVRAASPAGTPRHPVTQTRALPGRGTEGIINQTRYLLGNHRLIHEQGLCSPALEQSITALEQQGKTVIGLCDPQQVLALFAVADTLKPTSTAAIHELQQMGIQTILLTGDNTHTAHAIATQAGISQALGDQLPEDKLRAVTEASQHGPVGMVGDGINDAPALAQATIGFAMGALGTDIALETADVALMNDDLRKIPVFLRLSRATRRILLQNISAALGIKALFLILTLAGMGTLWMAVFADVGASLLVVANGMRLLRTRVEFSKKVD
jgi:Cd2+/Zn2+-exporting ATPase